MRSDTYIRLNGGMLEKLIDIAVKDGAAFSTLRRTNARTLVLSCDMRSADILLGLCRRYKINAKLLRFRGVYALWQRIKARWTLLPALLIALAAMLFFFGRIWFIDIAFVGTNAASGDAKPILACLEEYGVTCGVSSRSIQTGVLEKQLLSELSAYSFIGAQIQGVRLLIEAAPEIPVPEVYDIGSARDLVASRDGVIESIEVHSGSACVNVGDAVRKGQILILGEEQKSSEETSAVSALGEVYARCWFEGSASAERCPLVSKRTGNAHISRTLRLFSLRIPLLKCESFAFEESDTRVLPLIGLYLPIEIEIDTHYETQHTFAETDESLYLHRLQALARSDALAKLAAVSGEYSVRENWIEENIDDHTIGVRAVYEISTNIAVSRDALAKEDY